MFIQLLDEISENSPFIYVNFNYVYAICGSKKYPDFLCVKYADPSNVLHVGYIAVDSFLINSELGINSIETRQNNAIMQFFNDFEEDRQAYYLETAFGFPEEIRTTNESDL